MRIAPLNRLHVRGVRFGTTAKKKSKTIQKDTIPQFKILNGGAYMILVGLLVATIGIVVAVAGAVIGEKFIHKNDL